VPSSFVIVIDTRENLPYKFPVASVTKKLQSGDYSIVGLENQVAVERKTRQDGYQSLGQGRKRFENEFRRLSEFKFSAVVIESSIIDFLEQPAYTKMDPHAAINSLISWMVKYKVCVIWAGDRLHGSAMTFRILEKFWRSLNV